MLCYIFVLCSFVVRRFAHGAMGRQIDPSWGGPIELCAQPILVCINLMTKIMSNGFTTACLY